MANTKTQETNKIVLNKIISIYAKDPKIEIKNSKKKLYELGRIAAQLFYETLIMELELK